MKRLWFIVWIVASVLTGSITLAQNTPFAPCGIADDIAYPIESINTRTLNRGFDDFGLYRARWEGYHTGIDVGFFQAGTVIRAAARGRVTLADPTEWDEQRGVVVIEHIFPDNARYYTLYGHVEEGIDVLLPSVDTCVELGDPIGVIGEPTLSAPHLHFEIRNFLPDRGGPGYVEDDPTSSGWYHPLDFIHLWWARFSPAFVDSVTFDRVPAVPPIQLENGLSVLASDNIIVAISPPETTMWRLSTDGFVDGLAALNDSRVVAHTENGQVVVLNGGSYEAVWSVASLPEPFILLDDETLVFVTEGGGLEAYTATGDLAWQIAPPYGTGGIVGAFSGGGTQVAVSISSGDDAYWYMVDADGTILFEREYDRLPLFTQNSDLSWTVLDGTEFTRVVNNEETVTAPIDVAYGALSTLITDRIGNIYVYTGRSGNRLISWDFSGNLRWEAQLNGTTENFEPLLATNLGCVLYTLDTRGQLTLLSGTTGEVVAEQSLYPGGSRSRRPDGRVLTVSAENRVRLNAGFLTTITFDGTILGADALSTCLLG